MMKMLFPNRIWLNWQKGRQQSGYDKLLLAYISMGIKVDLFLLRFPIGSEIPPHRDIVKAGRHFRLNIIIKKSKEGGEFICEKPILNLDRIKLFRSDVYTHSVTKVSGSTRYVLSVGWILAA